VINRCPLNFLSMVMLRGHSHGATTAKRPTRGVNTAESSRRTFGGPLSTVRKRATYAVVSALILTLNATAPSWAISLPAWTTLPSTTALQSSIANGAGATILSSALLSPTKPKPSYSIGALELVGQNTCMQRGHFLTIDPTLVAPCVLGDRRAAKTVVLVGDSEGEMWLPALNIWGLRAHVKILRYVYIACPPWHLPLASSTPNWTNCSTKWHNYVEDAIQKLHPYAVIASGMPDVAQEASTKNSLSTVTAGMSEFFRAIQSATPRRVILSNIPWFLTTSRTPVACAMFHRTALQRCNGSPKTSLDATMTSAIKTTVANKLATVLWTKQFFCTETVCPVVVANRFVYSDSHHLNYDWSLYIARAFGQKLSPLLGLPQLP